MKRYYLVPPGLLPHELPDVPHVGEYHYIDLDSHGAAGAGHRAVVLFDDRRQVPAGWLALPHLLDAQTTLGSHAAAPTGAAAKARAVATLPLLADVGAKATHGTYQLAKQLALHHPMFDP